MKSPATRAGVIKIHQDSELLIAQRRRSVSNTAFVASHKLDGYGKS